MADGAPKGLSRAELCAYVNAQPILLSLLYDLSLLPEQVDEGTRNDQRLHQVVGHFRLLLGQLPPETQPHALAAALRSRARDTRFDAARITPGFEGPTMQKAMLDEQAADALDIARAQMSELSLRLQQSETRRRAAEATVTEGECRLAVLRATTGTPASQW